MFRTDITEMADWALKTMSYLRTLYACQVELFVGGSGLRCCTCDTISIERDWFSLLVNMFDS